MRRMSRMSRMVKIIPVSALCLVLMCNASAFAKNNDKYEAARAQVSAADAVLKKTEMDDGYTEYTFISLSELAEWDVYVDASGKVARVHLDYEFRNPGAKKLSAEEARKALLALEPGATVNNTLEEREDGGVQYKIFYTRPDGSAGIAKIDAATGALLENDITFGTKAAALQEGKPNMTMDEAKALILGKVTNGRIIEMERDTDDGRATFEGKVYGNEGVYEFEIDIATGTFTKWEIDD